jgi:phosphate transport system permease protein
MAPPFVFLSPVRKKLTYRLLVNKLAGRSFFLLAVLACLLIFFIGGGLLYKSWPVITDYNIWELLSSSEWKPAEGGFGFLSFIVSTFWVTIIATVIAVPVCLLASIYLIEYADRRIRSFVMPIVDILAGIPSVIFGIWGVLAIVPFVSFLGRTFNIETEGYSILAGGLVLSVMVFPILINIFCEVLRIVPNELRDAALSLGATKWETIRIVVLRKAKAGLFAAIILGFSRALGETIAVLMVVGNSPAFPHGMFDMGYPIPALIANNYGEMMSIPLYEAALMFSALLLFVIIVLFNAGARVILVRMEKGGK